MKYEIQKFQNSRSQIKLRTLWIRCAITLDQVIDIEIGTREPQGKRNSIHESCHANSQKHKKKINKIKIVCEKI